MVIDLSLLNQYIKKQPFKTETVKSVRQFDINQQLDCLHRPDRCLSTCSDSPSIQEVSSVLVGRSGLPIHGLTFRNVPKSVDFHQTNGHNSSTLTSFPYLDDWLIRGLICNWLVSHTKYCLQTVQSLGFILNLKKSDLIPVQKLTFIGMEFLTQLNIVRVPADRVDSLLLTIKVFLSQTSVLAQTFFSLLGKLSAAADFVLLGRLHL